MGEKSATGCCSRLPVSGLRRTTTSNTGSPGSPSPPPPCMCAARRQHQRRARARCTGDILISLQLSGMCRTDKPAPSSLATPPHEKGTTAAAACGGSPCPIGRCNASPRPAVSTPTRTHRLGPARASIARHEQVAQRHLTCPALQRTTRRQGRAAQEAALSKKQLYPRRLGAHIHLQAGSPLLYLKQAGRSHRTSLAQKGCPWGGCPLFGIQAPLPNHTSALALRPPLRLLPAAPQTHRDLRQLARGVGLRHVAPKLRRDAHHVPHLRSARSTGADHSRSVQEKEALIRSLTGHAPPAQLTGGAHRRRYSHMQGVESFVQAGRAAGLSAAARRQASRHEVSPHAPRQEEPRVPCSHGRPRRGPPTSPSAPRHPRRAAQRHRCTAPRPAPRPAPAVAARSAGERAVEASDRPGQQAGRSGGHACRQAGRPWAAATLWNALQGWPAAPRAPSARACRRSAYAQPGAKPRALHPPAASALRPHHPHHPP